MREALLDHLDALRTLLEGGGMVMPLLVGCAAWMWYCIAWRGLVVLPGRVGVAEPMWDAAIRGGPVRGAGVVGQAVRRLASELEVMRTLGPDEREEWVNVTLGDLRALVGRNRSLATSLVVTAPLLGLLGTVSGMIETFDALGQQALFRQGGGIAGGISEALLTTQMGLVIAVPGTLVARMIDRREDGIRRDLALLEALARRDGEVA